MADLIRPRIDFDPKGIGQVLMDRFLSVPPNQRDYAWSADNVDDLFSDLSRAQRGDQPEYFLGMLVMTVGETSELLIADGQQRLATTTILLAAIRDYLDSHDAPTKAAWISDKFLYDSDIEADEPEPKLRLNLADDEFFRKRILSPVGSPERSFPATKQSHKRLEVAARLAAEQAEKIAGNHSPEVQVQNLIGAVNYIRRQAFVVLAVAPDEYSAYRMFETLNDRGARAAQSDLLKNYLMGTARDRSPEVQQRWAAMVAVLEGAGDDNIVRFLRHYYIVNYEHVRERALFTGIRDRIKTRAAAVEFADALSLVAPDYNATRDPLHEKWEPYGETTRGHIATLRMLRVDQFRPLVFAVAKGFSVAEGRKALRLLVSCGVRLLVGGGSRVGRIDRELAERASDIGAGRITTARELVGRMAPLMPSDAEFEVNFSVATISKGDLARYVLRALESRKRDEKHPELVPNANQDVINLEHVLPGKPSAKWHLDADLMLGLHKRIGNLVLLQKNVNGALGNSAFSEKRKALKQSTFRLTAEVGASPDWNADTIAARQTRMAKLAVETWPISV